MLLDQLSHFPIVDWVICYLTLIIALVGLIVNGILLWLLGFHMERNPFSVYILNLAMTDFLYLCCHIILLLHMFFIPYYSMFYYILSLFFIMWLFAYIASLSILDAISIERSLSVLFPIWYHCHRSRHTSAVVCALLWVLSLTWSSLEGTHCVPPVQEFMSEFNSCLIIHLTLSILLLVLLVSFLGSSLALLVRILIGSRQKLVNRLYVTIGLTVFVFLLFGLPWPFYNMLKTFGVNFDVSPQNIFLVSLILSAINSCANPIIYFFVGSFRQWSQRQQNLWLVLQRALQDTPEEDRCGDPSSQEALEMTGSGVGQ